MVRSIYNYYINLLFKQITRVTACLLVIFSIFTSVAVGQTNYTSSLSGGENPLDGIPSPGNAVITGDFDNDGDIDVLAYDNSNYNSFSFFANDGAGSFSEATGSDNPFSGLTASDIFYASINTIVADFDNDGDQDIWDFEGSSDGDGQSIYLENNGGNNFSSSLAGGSNPLSGVPDTDAGVITGDFDSDGDVDVLAFDDDTFNSFSYFENDGSGGFTEVTGSQNPFNSLSASDLFFNEIDTYREDFDNDGDIDIWDFEGDNTINNDDVYLENVNGSYTSSASGGDNPLSAVPETANGVITGDFDSDGDVDVLAFDDDSYNSFTFYANDGGGNFSSVSGSDNPFSGLSATDIFYASNQVYTQDFDNDGDTDIWDYEGNNDDIYLKKQGSPSNNATPTDISLSSTTVKQSGGVNATIGTLSTSDPDGSDTHTYSLVSGSGDDDNASFNIDASTLRTDNASTLAPGNYSLRIQTSDDKGATFAKAFSITVNDDLAPNFKNSTPSVSGTTVSQTTLSVQLNEIGTAYYVVVADDDGTPSSAQVKAGQDSGGGTALASGSISVSSASQSFNDNITGLSSSTSYDIYIVAEDDEGGPNLQGSPAKLNVTTLNEAPNFTTLAGPVESTNEDTGVEVTFSDITAQGDESDDGTVTAFVVQSINDGTLSINGSAYATGTNDEITSSKSANWTPDPDANGTLNAFTIVAKDNAGAESSTAVQAQVEVTPINDAPVITSNGGGESASIDIPENTTSVTTVTATDPDGDTPTFALSGGADSGLFSIDSNSGDLRFASAPDNESPSDNNGDNIYQITVISSDGNGGTDTQDISVTVTNVNEAPAFTDGSNTTLAVNEDYGPTAINSLLEVVDDDNGDTLTWSVSSAPSKGSLGGFPTSKTSSNSALSPTGLTYTPDADATGADSFDIQISDGTETKVITVDVSINDRPTVSITSGESDPTNAAPFDLTVTFSESVTGFSASDLAVGNGSVNSISGSGSTYTVSVSPTNDGAVTVDIPAGSATDADGANNEAAAQFSIDYDGTVPAAPTSLELSAASDTGISNTDGITSDDTPTINGNAEASSTIEVYSDQDGSLGTATADGSGDWSFTPSSTLSETTHTITATATDAAGNNSASSDDLTITVDATAPQLTASSPADGSSDANYQTDITLTFDEDLVAGTSGDTNIEVYLDDGTLHESLDISQVNIADKTVTATLSNDLTPAENYYVLVGSDALADEAGNLFSGISNSSTLRFSIANEAPVAGNDTGTTEEEKEVVVDVLGNDSDSEGNLDPSSVTVTSAPANGSTTVNTTTGAITYAPDTNFAGSDSFEYTVSDFNGGISQTATVSISVNGVNDAPDITAPSSVSPNEDTDFAFSGTNAISITDVDAGSGELSVDLAVNNGSLTLDTTTGLTFDSGSNSSRSWTISGSLSDLNSALATLIFKGTTDFNGSDNLSMVVNDGGNTGSDPGLSGDASSEEDQTTITLNVQSVNDDPIFSSDPTADINENNSGVVLDVNATDGEGGAVDQNITYMISGTGSGPFSIDKNSGALSLDNEQDFEAPADENQDNEYEITVTASDGANSVSQNITVSINDVRPTMANQSVGSVDENATNGTVVGTIATSDDTPTRFSITGGNTDGAFQIDNSGQVSVANQGTIDYETNNQYDLTVEANDKSSGSGITATISVSINDEDEVPVFLSSGSVNFPENSTDAVIDVNANDGEANSADENISYSLGTADDSSLFTIDKQSGVLSFSSPPDFEQPSDQDTNSKYIVHVRADDGNKSTTQILSVTVTAVNDAPVISGTPDTKIDEDADYSFTPSASDPENDDLTFSITNKPSWADFDNGSGKLYGTPANKDVGSTTDIEISVSDGNGGSASLAAFDLEVENTNDAPVVDQGIQDQEAIQNADFTFEIPTHAFKDIDKGDALTLSVSGLPDGLGFNASNKTISGTPTDTNLGSNLIQVTATDQSNATVTTSFDLSIKPETPGQIILATPTNESENLNLRPKLQWEEMSSARTYELQLATSNSFAKEVVVVKEENISETSLSISVDLNRNTTYFWRVRGHNFDATGDWSETFSFTTIPEVPAKVTLDTPEDEAQDVSLTPVFKWNSSARAQKYNFQLATGTAFSQDQIVTSRNELSTIEFEQENPLEREKTYYWRIRATNSGGEGEWSSVYQFTTLPQVPAQVTLASPEDNAGSIVLDSTLSWQAVQRAVTYDLEIAADEEFSNIITSKQNLSSLTYTPDGDLKNNTLYHWRVRANNVAGKSAWSKPRRFTTIAATPLLSFPADEEQMISIAPRLSWQSKQDTTTYRVQVGTDPQLSNFIADTLLSGTSLSLTGLETKTEYFWRVRVQTEQTTSAYSSIRTFQTRSSQEESIEQVQITFGDNSQNGSRSLTENDYRLLGLPGRKEMRVDELFDGTYGDDWKVFADNGNTQDFLIEHSEENPLSFTDGTGYWALSKTPLSVGGDIDPVQISRNDTYGIDLEPGWNIISNPFSRPTDWKEIQSFNQRSLTLFGYDGSFYESSTMDPFYGYYVYNDEDQHVTLDIPYTSIKKRVGEKTSKNADKIAAVPKKVTLHIKSEHQDRAAEVHIKYHSNKNETKRHTEYMPPLELSNFGAALVDETRKSRKRYLHTLGDTFDRQRKHYSVEIKAKQRGKLKWKSKISGFEKDMAILIIEPSKGRSRIIQHDQVEYFMTEKGRKQFEIYAGTVAELQEVQENMLPEKITLNQNYPNPFNPSTTIQFGINQQSDVTLEIFNILGRKVRTLVNERMQQGWHKVSFDGSRLASGTYFYRLMVGQKIQTKKMVLIK